LALGTEGSAVAAGGVGGAGATDLTQALAQGVNALGLGLTASQRGQLLDYLGLLQRWNRVYNLTALRDREDMLSHHLLDCLAVVPRLAEASARASSGPTRVPSTQTVADTGAVVCSGATTAATATPDQAATKAMPAATGQAAVPAAALATGVAQLRILDVGSGGGLPGVVLAICQPDWQVTCVDTVAKKASFIRQAAAELRLPNLRPVHARVEQLAASPVHRFEVIVARAFSSLSDFVALTRDLLESGGCWMAMKGAVPTDEIAQLPSDIEVFHVEQLAVPGLEARRCLVWMRIRQPTAA